MANVLIIVEKGMITSIETDEVNCVVRVVDRDLPESKISDYIWPYTKAGDLYKEHMLDLGYGSFSVGDTVVVEGDWFGTIRGFKKDTDGSIIAQVEDQEGEVYDQTISSLEFD